MNQVINNWLINAQNRKWRPALEQAYKLGRPATFLREDSLKIYEGVEKTLLTTFASVPDALTLINL